MKKLLALFLAVLTLCMALAVTANAAGDEPILDSEKTYNATTLYEKDKGNIPYEDHSERSGYIYLYATRDGWYNIFTYSYDTFKDNFEYYQIVIYDANGNVAPWNNARDAFLMTAGQTYKFTIKYKFKSYDYSGVKFWFEKQYDLGTGWMVADGQWYYAQSGTLLRNTWMKDSIGWVYLGSDGAMKTNAWVQDSVGWCYVGANGYAVTNTWKQDSVGWCYLNSNGSMTKNSWVYSGGKWYFLDGNGYMVSNQWRLDSQGWCYLGADGAMVTNGWVPDSVDVVYVGASGYMLTNTWVPSGSDWYFVGANGYRLKNQWKNDSLGWCYLGEDGAMVTNTWIKDTYAWCYLDGSGYWNYVYYDAPLGV